MARPEHTTLFLLVFALMLSKSCTADIKKEISQADEEIDIDFGDFFKNKRYVIENHSFVAIRVL